MVAVAAMMPAVAVTNVAAMAPVAGRCNSVTVECKRHNSQEKHPHRDSNQSLHRPTPSGLM
jgi:hypothetical protein